MRELSLRLHGKDTTRKYNEHQYNLGKIKKRIKKRNIQKEIQQIRGYFGCVAPRAGLEPATERLTVVCSTN